MEFAFFFGRFHVLAVHLPIGIICVAVAMDIFATRERFSTLRSASYFLWIAAALTAVVTVLLGYLHSLEGGFEGESFSRHRALGILVAVTASLMLFMRGTGRNQQRVSVLGGIGILVLVALTGHYGGNMTHGSSYLTQYAPRILGVAHDVQAAKPVSIETADIFADVVHPMLELRCADCHGQEMRKKNIV